MPAIDQIFLKLFAMYRRILRFLLPEWSRTIPSAPFSAPSVEHSFSTPSESIISTRSAATVIVGIRRCVVNNSGTGISRVIVSCHRNHSSGYKKYCNNANQNHYVSLHFSITSLKFYQKLLFTFS